MQVALHFLPDGPPLTVDFTAGRRRRLGGNNRGWRDGKAQKRPERALSDGSHARFPHARWRRELQSATVQVRGERKKRDNDYRTNRSLAFFFSLLDSSAPAPFATTTT